MAANATSRALHLKCSFSEVGIRERLSHLDGVWHYVVLYEHCSPKTGGPGMPTRGCG